MFDFVMDIRNTASVLGYKFDKDKDPKAVPKRLEIIHKLQDDLQGVHAQSKPGDAQGMHVQHDPRHLGRDQIQGI